MRAKFQLRQKPSCHQGDIGMRRKKSLYSKHETGVWYHLTSIWWSRVRDLRHNILHGKTELRSAIK